MEHLPLDIIDYISTFLDFHSFKNLLLTSPQFYHLYNSEKTFFTKILIYKICEHFPYFEQLNIKIIYKTLSHNQKKELYITLNFIFNKFKSQPYTDFSDILFYLCLHKLTNTILFNLILSKCVSFNHLNIQTYAVIPYNAIKNDDVLYLLSYSPNISPILQQLYITPHVLIFAIKFKISNQHHEHTIELINYLLFKYFFRYSIYIQELIMIITRELIKFDQTDILQILFDKQKLYDFNLDHQCLIKSCIEFNNSNALELIYTKFIEINNLYKSTGRNITPILITKEQVRHLMKIKSFQLLIKIIQFYLKDLINLPVYIKEISHHFDKHDTNCLQILSFLNETNVTFVNNYNNIA